MHQEGTAVVCYILGANPPASVITGFINRIWRKHGYDNLSFLQNGVFLVHFPSVEAQQAALQGGYLLFDNKPLIVKELTPGLKLAKETVTSVPVWIRLIDLNLKFWGKKCLEKLAGEVGKFVRCDVYIEQRIHIAYARILVELPMDQPIVKEVSFLDENDVLCVVKVEHEWLPVMCTKCSGFGHGADGCKRVKGVQVWRRKAVQPAQPVVPPPANPVHVVPTGAIPQAATIEGRPVMIGRGFLKWGTFFIPMIMVNVGLWNIRGLNSLTKQKEIKWFLHKNKVELFGLLETKIRSSGINKLAAVLGSSWSFCTNYSCNEKGRVWLLWNLGGFHVQGVECDAQCVYLKCNVTGPWLWCGDFNCVRAPDERLGQPVTLAEIRDFRDCVTRCGISDIKATSSFFTWNNKQVAEHRVFSRLDRAMHNMEWGMEFSEAFAQFLPKGLFDHCLCIISLLGVIGKRSHSFKYFNMWSAAPEFGDIVRQGWDTQVRGTPMFKVITKLRNLKGRFKVLNRTMFSNVEQNAQVSFHHLEDCQARVRSNPFDLSVHEEEREATDIYRRLHTTRVDFLAQKAKAQWYDEGDDKTTFFHSVIKARRSQNKVLMIKDLRGVMCAMPELINNAFEEYYKGLLGTRSKVDDRCSRIPGKK
ncbi:hypothetical protein RND81_06G080100 [Saponaria officinalis]|uniref:DUF4283 domain-containing protein n=1 Tax=Saponaria officinalis TaxID=3572 RepID=A0AAW1K8M5_SAPOF